MRVSMYVDGFNLYYTAVRGTSYKWLDLRKMSALMMPELEVGEIKYFTARISARLNHPKGPQNQQAYLKALSTDERLTIYYGHFRCEQRGMRLAPCCLLPNTTIQVLKTQEKGSDVNLATEIMIDAFQDRYDLALLVSNDSDLVRPVQTIRARLGKKVGLLLADRVNPSKQLIKNTDFVKRIREGVLRESQFPIRMHYRGKNVHRPEEW